MISLRDLGTRTAGSTSPESDLVDALIELARVAHAVRDAERALADLRRHAPGSTAATAALETDIDKLRARYDAALDKVPP